MKNIIKTITKRILLLALLVICLCSFSCAPSIIVVDGVEYYRTTNGHIFYYCTCGIAEDARDEEILYVLDEIDGVSVIDINVYMGDGVLFDSEDLERIYFPWTISVSEADFSIESSKEHVYLISSSLKFLCPDKYEYCLVVPVVGYEKLDDFEKSDALPANIAYMFNHPGNPNEGYFFVDLIEESGKIMKPPYDPRRVGYTFLGWYKDEACTEKWDFETDEITIQFDEEGNRIYEEIQLYAGWEEQRDYGEDLIYPENIAFMLNYEGAPNNGYYYTSSKHSTGTINEPIKPKRVGCIFEGWYKDAECTEAWNFETDEITIQFDEQGNHIYEEIRLYAKWTVK